ncbi:unnamed protein product [Urochloa decumbens]|uniref:Uncharacterized protein n=1 Tax=Urochloa decumbens TaxID=240449 RepID=A0ABC8W811_9POAL
MSLHGWISIRSSELGPVVALLASNLHVGDAEDEAAVGVCHSVALDEAPEDGDPAGDPGAGLHGDGPALHVRHQLRQVIGEAVGLHRQGQLDLAVAPAGDAARVDLGVAHVRAAVRQVGVAPRVVGEGGRVRVVHGHREEERHVELQGHRREGQARCHPGQARRDEAGGGVPDLEHGQEEHQQGDGQRGQDGERDEEAHARAPPAAAARVVLLGLGG